MQLRQALLFVKDLQQMIAFYGTIVGFNLIVGTRSDTWAEFEGGLALHAIPSHIAEEIVIESPAVPRQETPIKLIFTVADLDAISTRLEGLGVTVMRRPWGACDCIDPEGNIFQLSS